MDLNPKDGLAIFTDDSAYYQDRTGGWAWVALDAYGNTHAQSGSATDTTISRMELSGPTEGLKFIADEFGPCDILVYSDSQYVVFGCQDRSRKRNKNIDCWDALDAAIELHNEVQFHHVKGHADNAWNNLADELAGEARCKL